MNKKFTDLFVSAVVRKTFAERDKELARLENRAAHCAYKILVPEKMHKLMDALPDNYFVSKRAVQFTLQRGAGTTKYCLVHATKPVKIPAFVLFGTRTVIKSKPLERYVDAEHEAAYALLQDKTKLRRQLHALCKGCRSKKSLVAAWPEAEGYITDEMSAPKTQAMVISAQELNSQIACSRKGNCSE